MSRTDTTPDVLGKYLHEIRHPLLTADGEQERDRQIANRPPREQQPAREKLTRFNLRLVVAIAKKYTGLGLELTELIGFGNLGLLKAVDKFDYQRGYHFSTHANNWIKQAMRRAIEEHRRTVLLPAHIYVDAMRLRRCQAELALRLGRQATNEELASALRWTVSKSPLCTVRPATHVA